MKLCSYARSSNTIDVVHRFVNYKLGMSFPKRTATALATESMRLKPVIFFTFVLPYFGPVPKRLVFRLLRL